MTKPEFVTRNPTRYEPATYGQPDTIIMDDGYRPNCEYDHPCGTGAMHWECDAINEAGWFCTDCLDKIGRSLALDKIELFTKCHDILIDMKMASLVSVSNASEGESIVYTVMHRCVDDDAYDQYSIIQFVMLTLAPGHARFWRGRNEPPEQYLLPYDNMTEVPW